MKRSRIFLGATSALLAIAGVAAAKMSHFSTNLTRYYCTQIVTNGNVCLPYTKQTCVTINNVGTKTCFFTAGSTHSNTVYTLYSDGVIKPAGSFLSCSSGCTAAVVYSTLAQ